MCFHLYSKTIKLHCDFKNLQFQLFSAAREYNLSSNKIVLITEFCVFLRKFRHSVTMLQINIEIEKGQELAQMIYSHIQGFKIKELKMVEN